MKRVLILVAGAFAFGILLPVQSVGANLVDVAVDCAAINGSATHFSPGHHLIDVQGDVNGAHFHRHRTADIGSDGTGTFAIGIDDLTSDHGPETVHVEGEMTWVGDQPPKHFDFTGTCGNVETTTTTAPPPTTTPNSVPPPVTTSTSTPATTPPTTPPDDTPCIPPNGDSTACGHLANTGPGSLLGFSIMLGTALLMAGLVFKFAIRRAPKGELRGYWKRTDRGVWR